MLIAITGAAGFIGRHLAFSLAAENHALRLLVHRQDVDPPGEKHFGSLGDEASLLRFLQGVDLLFHLASVLGGRNLGAREFFAANRDGTRNLLAAAAACGVRKVVHFSSAGVYGSNSGLVPLRETDPLDPRDRYERSKLAGEKEALAFTDRMDVSIIRPGWVYGEGDRRTFKLIQRVHEGPFFIAGSGRPRHAVIHVADLVRLAWLAAEKGRRGGIYNSGGENLSVAEIVAAIAAALDGPRRIRRIPLPVVRPAAWMTKALFGLFRREAPLTPSMLAFFGRGKPLDGSRALADLGFAPEIRFNEGIGRAVGWYRRQGWL